MLGILAVLLFLLALIFQLAGIALGPVTFVTLVIAGLLCLALTHTNLSSRL